MRAEEDRIDASAGQRHGLDHLVVDGIQGVHVEQAAPDARLVGRHHHAIAPLRQAGDRLQAAGQRTPLVRRLDELVAVVVDDAVAVEDDQLHAESLDRSATRFMAACSPASRPRRLARSAASSTFTMTWSKKASTGPFSAASACSELV
jgi:hypothetical protein